MEVAFKTNSIEKFKKGVDSVSSYPTVNCVLVIPNIIRQNEMSMETKSTPASFSFKKQVDWHKITQFRYIKIQR